MPGRIRPGPAGTRYTHRLPGCAPASPPERGRVPTTKATQLFIIYMLHDFFLKIHKRYSTICTTHTHTYTFVEDILLQILPTFYIIMEFIYFTSFLQSQKTKQKLEFQKFFLCKNYGYSNQRVEVAMWWRRLWG